MSDLKAVAAVFLLGFVATFSALFLFDDEPVPVDSMEQAQVQQVNSGDQVVSESISFLDSIRLSLGVVPEVKNPQALKASQQPLHCSLPKPSAEAEIIVVRLQGGKEPSPIQIDDEAGELTSLINLPIGRYKKPVYLFLQSYQSVLWNLNVPPGVKVEGVVAVSHNTSALANVPEGTPKLIMSEVSELDGDCPVWPFSVNSEDTRAAFEPEVEAFLGRQPDRWVSRHVTSLIELEEEGASVEGISWLDARNIYSIEGMYLGRTRTREAMMDGLHRAGALVTIDGMDAKKLLIENYDATDEETLQQIEVQFIRITQPYHVVLRDFYVPRELRGRHRASLFVPRDVRLTAIEIPPASNPDPEPVLPLRSAGGDELGPTTEDERAARYLALINNDKYFRQSGFYYVAPLELTLSEVREIISLDPEKRDSEPPWDAASIAEFRKREEFK